MCLENSVMLLSRLEFAPQGSNRESMAGLTPDVSWTFLDSLSKEIQAGVHAFGELADNVLDVAAQVHSYDMLLQLIPLPITYMGKCILFQVIRATQKMFGDTRIHNLDVLVHVVLRP